MRALCGAIITCGAVIGLGLTALGIGTRYSRDQLDGLARELRAVRGQFAELGREAEAQAQATREERAAVRREVAELRDQVRDSYHKALKEALDGLEQVRAGAADVPAGLRES